MGQAKFIKQSKFWSAHYSIALFMGQAKFIKQSKVRSAPDIIALFMCRAKFILQKDRYVHRSRHLLMCKFKLINQRVGLQLVVYNGSN